MRAEDIPRIALLESPGECRTNAVIGQHLGSGIVTVYRQVGSKLRTQFAAPGEVNLRADVNQRFGRVRIINSAERVFSLVLARYDGLQRKRVVMGQGKIISGPSEPG